MRADLLARLDAHWAKHLGCDPATLHNENTNIIADPGRKGAEVWLVGKTCVILAAPPLAAALKASVGNRNPIVAFEPARLREVIAFFGLELQGPEAILVAAEAGAEAGVQTLSLAETPAVAWLPPSPVAAEVETAARAAPGIPLVAISIRDRAARRAAESCGFVLYASVIYLGDKANYP